MLSESTRKNKENISRLDFSKENNSLVNSAIANLRQEIVTLQQEKNMIEKQWAAEVDVLTLELSQYKKKFSSLTDKYLIETFTRERHNSKETQPDHEKMARQKQILLQQQQENKRKLQEQLKKSIDENVKLKKEITILRYEKEKSMEIGLIQKIEYEEKNKLLEEQVKSKKNIISNLKKELEKAYADREQLGKRERTVQQKSKELDCFSRQVNEYNRLSEAKLNQKVSRLAKENEFLKNYVKKLQKIANKECECELKDEKVKENLFEIKRELALAKVRLGESYLKTKELPKKRTASPSSSDSCSPQPLAKR